MSIRPHRTPSDVPVAIEPDRFRRLGHELVDAIADHIATLPSRPLTPGAAPDAVRALVGAMEPLPEQGSDAAELLRETARLLADNSLFNAHPRFFGYITAPPTPIGVLGDLLASAMNPNVGGWTLAPVATEIEAQAVRWMGQLIGFREGCAGLLVSGGNMANFVGFLAARRAAAGEAVRQRGPEAARALRVYGSRETHTWIQKAADLFGLGTDAIRWIETDAQQRMNVSALRSAIERDRADGLVPMAVVAAAGTVSTGAVDPLREIAALCREHEVWLHVDGAYGGFAAAARDVVADGGPGSAEAAEELGALALADSVAVDPHKWLYAPLEAGCLLARDAQCLTDAFSYHPPYYHFGQEATNFVDLGPQNSRGFRALKVWLALRQVGRAGYTRMIGDDVRLARRLWDRVVEHPELEPFTQALSITTFRYVPRELQADAEQAHGADGSAVAANGSAREPVDSPRERRIDELNRELLDRLQKGGEAFVSNAVIDGRYVLRACVVNFNTTDGDIDALPGIVTRVGREIFEG